GGDGGVGRGRGGTAAGRAGTPGGGGDDRLGAGGGSASFPGGGVRPPSRQARGTRRPAPVARPAPVMQAQRSLLGPGRLSRRRRRGGTLRSMRRAVFRSCGRVCVCTRSCPRR